MCVSFLFCFVLFFCRFRLEAFLVCQLFYGGAVCDVFGRVVFFFAAAAAAAAAVVVVIVVLVSLWELLVLV